MTQRHLKKLKTKKLVAFQNKKQKLFFVMEIFRDLPNRPIRVKFRTLKLLVNKSRYPKPQANQDI